MSGLTMMRRCACAAFFALGTAGFAFPSAFAQGIQMQRSEGASVQLPVEISPEGVVALVGVQQPFLLLDASDPDRAKEAQGTSARRIYFTKEPSFRAAHAAVIRDRLAGSTAVRVNEPGIPGSQRLTGTPLDWRRAGLKFHGDPVPSRPLQLTPRQLSEALKDGVDLQVIDLRPLPPRVGASATDTQTAPFADSALRMMPHEIDSELPKLSKLRWIVLVDGGGQAAMPIAENMHQRGFSLVAVLQGGWPAWVAATDR
ncbi:rhodanese-like domain-containing protein [Variovorax paradoxus]|uniref:rhodanese-like domain-containing protein n=1 Tax=Variovorax paradoxus TaxID=34073 RepID=UPI003D646A25